MEEKRDVYRLLIGKPEGNRPLGRPRRRWVNNNNNNNNNKMDLVEIGMRELHLTGLSQDRYRWRALVNSVMNLRVP
jgi:hypothetical protein